MRLNLLIPLLVLFSLRLDCGEVQREMLHAIRNFEKKNTEFKVIAISNAFHFKDNDIIINKSYDRATNLLRTLEYRAQDLVPSSRYERRFYSRSPYSNVMISGMRLWFNSLGYVRAWLPYSNGRPEGMFRLYDDTGSMIDAALYTNGLMASDDDREFSFFYNRTKNGKRHEKMDLISYYAVAMNRLLLGDDDRDFWTVPVEREKLSLCLEVLKTNLEEYSYYYKDLILNGYILTAYSLLIRSDNLDLFLTTWRDKADQKMSDICAIIIYKHIVSIPRRVRREVYGELFIEAEYDNIKNQIKEIPVAYDKIYNIREGKRF